MGRWIRIEPLAIHSTSAIKKAPAAPGCYAIYLDGTLVYIGQSTNVAKRILSYRLNYSWGGSVVTPWGYCEDLFIKYRPSLRYGDWAMVELRLIKRIQPVFNCVGSVKKRRAAAA